MSMYRITGLMLYPMKKDLVDNNKYHIEIAEEEQGKVYCVGYIYAEVQNNILQYYQFSVDLSYDGGEELTHEQILNDFKLKSIITTICGILFNNGIGKE